MPPRTPAKDWPIPPMDHAAGHKDTAFTWAMGRLILQRMGDRETMKAITGTRGMPSYATVYQWVRVLPEFGEAYRAVRLALARAMQAERAALRALRAEARAADRVAAGKRPRDWVSGRPSSYTQAWAEAFCEAVADGAAVSAVVRRPGMPSSKLVYTWLKRRPEFKAMYVEACRRREVTWWFHRDLAIDSTTPFTLAAGKRTVAAIEGRIGRLTPKVYRSPDAPWRG